MRIRYRAIMLVGLMASTGCTTDEFNRFWDNPFNTAERFDPEKAPAASAKAATRVHSLGNAIVAANGADITIKPIFFTIGLPEAMLFHQGNGEVVISEGLVNRCSTDAELAAILSHELATMMADQEERNSPRSRERELPPAPRLTPDITGSGNSPDMTRAAEEGYLRRNQRDTATARPSRPDSTTLAKAYLQKAGYDAADYARVETMLRDAEKNAADRSFMRRR